MTELFATEAEEILALACDVKGECETMIKRSACKISKGRINTYYYFGDNSVIVYNTPSNQFEAKKVKI